MLKSDFVNTEKGRVLINSRRVTNFYLGLGRVLSVPKLTHLVTPGEFEIKYRVSQEGPRE